jgi:endonuclease G
LYHSQLSILASALVLAIAVLPAGAIIDATLQMQLGNPSGATADPTNHDHFLIQRPVEAMDYSDHLGQPNWASWDLTSGDVGSSACHYPHLLQSLLS